MDRYRQIVLTSLLAVLLLWAAERRTWPPEGANLPDIQSPCCRTERGGSDGVAVLRCPSTVVTTESTEGRGQGSCGRELPHMTSARDEYALGWPMDLQRATEGDLRLLPGIGKARARAIVKLREGQKGGVSRREDLARVRGIGPVTVERLRRITR